MNLRSQRRMAAEILRVGRNRVWIDPEKASEVELAIAREEIRRLIHEKAIRKLQEKGISRSRAKILHEKRKRGKLKGLGRRSGSKGARAPSKEAWMKRIRALRKRLRGLRDRHTISETAYRQLYVMAKSGSFRSVADMDRYIDSSSLRRRR